MQKDKVLQLMKIFAEKLGGTVSDIKMMKLLYFTDRLSLTNTGHPISYDDYYSLNRGPILSGSKSLIDEGADESYTALFAPVQACKSPQGYPLKRFSLKEKHIDIDALSECELELADLVFEEFGSLDDDEIVQYSHRGDVCPEWSWPNGSSIPIKIETIFQSIGIDAEVIAEQMAEINYHKKLIN